MVAVVTVAGLRRFVAKMADMPGDSLVNLRELARRGGVRVLHPDDSSPDLEVRFEIEDLPER